MTLRTLNYGNYGIFLIMGHAGFCPSTVVVIIVPLNPKPVQLSDLHPPVRQGPQVPELKGSRPRGPYYKL